MVENTEGGSMRNHLYRHFDKDHNLLYVGISLDAFNRLTQHRQNANWYDLISLMTIESFANRKELLAAEKIAIYKEKPVHNKIYANKKITSKLKSTTLDNFEYQSYKQISDITFYNADGSIRLKATGIRVSI